MSDLTKYNLEAKCRIEKALRHIEASQIEMDKASQELCSIVGMVPSWNKTRRVFDLIKALWHRLNAMNSGRKIWDLDENAKVWKDKFEAREGEEKDE